MSELRKEAIQSERLVELSKLYLGVALNHEVGNDETRQVAGDTVHALAELELLRAAVKAAHDIIAAFEKEERSNRWNIPTTIRWTK